MAGIFNDGTSLRKYGRKELNYTIPGFFSDEDAGIIGRSLLKRLSEPRIGATAGDIPIKDSQNYFQRGVYRLVLSFGSYSYEYSPVDRLDKWVKSGTGDLTPALEAENYVYGAASLKLTFMTAHNDQILISHLVNLGKIKKISLYIRSNLKGNFLSLGFGLNSILERMQKIDISVENPFLPIEFDLSSTEVREIGKLGFIVNENPSSEAVIQIDRIDFLISGFKTYNLEYKKATYTLKANRQE